MKRLSAGCLFRGHATRAHMPTLRRLRCVAARNGAQNLRRPPLVRRASPIAWLMEEPLGRSHSLALLSMFLPRALYCAFPRRTSRPLQRPRCCAPFSSPLDLCVLSLRCVSAVTSPLSATAPPIPIVLDDNPPPCRFPRSAVRHVLLLPVLCGLGVRSNNVRLFQSCLYSDIEPVGLDLVAY